jgi:hypothetical protein
VGILVPQSVYAVNGPLQTPNGSAPAVQDVALNADGHLVGQLIDVNGSPQNESVVRLQQDGRDVATVVTDRHGRFAVANVRAGLYQVTSDRANGVYRVWTAQAAPPAAHGRVLLVDQETVVRGQGGNWRRTLLIGGLIISAGVIGGVIGYNIRDVDDAS